MADKGGRGSGVGINPMPMKLFATWEVEKSTPNCIPRLCSLTLVRLVVSKPLENDLQSLIIAVKMQNSKRVLRSNEIILPANGLLDTDLDLSFSLQYPHFLKRDGNKLQVLLQRRKKYKNRTILGYKTLAIGQVNMAQVLQRSVDRELDLYSDLKERTNLVAQVTMLSLSSQPVDHEENGRQKLPSVEADRSPDGESDDEEPPEEYASTDEMSDSEPITRSRPRKSARSQLRPFLSRQRNLKQRFIALLKRFKVTEEALDSEEQGEELGDQPNPAEIEELFDELEDLSDSGPEMDTISVLSTPKPKLRPFFTGRGSSHDILEVPKDSGRQSDDSSRRNDSDSHVENLSDLDQSDPGKDFLGREFGGVFASLPKEEKKPRTHGKELKGSPFKDRKGSLKKEESEKPSSSGAADQGSAAEPRIALLEQLSTVLPTVEDSLPDHFILVNSADFQGQCIASALQEQNHRVISTCSAADVKATLSHLVNKIQKFCNTNSKAPAPVKVVIVGGDAYVNSVLCPYVEQFSNKSPDWQLYIRFSIIPTGASLLGRYLSKIDTLHNSLFMNYTWRDAFDKEGPRSVDAADIASRIQRYISSTNTVNQLPVAEAMVTYKDKNSNEESSQIFVPFINEVHIGPAEYTSVPMSISVDLEEAMAASAAASLSSSPPQSTNIEKARDRDSHTPPNSPNINSPFIQQGASGPPLSAPFTEYLDLQLDYWTLSSRPDSSDKAAPKKDTKVSLKSAFKSVQVFRLPHNGDASSSHLTMVIITKEKKQKSMGKVMRIGKKSKELESKSQAVEGISRLICTSKSQNQPFRVSIDGVEWTGVKFFQLSSQWQTHIKQFPVAVCGESEG